MWVWAAVIEWVLELNYQVPHHTPVGLSWAPLSIKTFPHFKASNTDYMSAVSKILQFLKTWLVLRKSTHPSVSMILMDDIKESLLIETATQHTVKGSGPLFWVSELTNMTVTDWQTGNIPASDPHPAPPIPFFSWKRIFHISLKVIMKDFSQTGGLRQTVNTLFISYVRSQV